MPAAVTFFISLSLLIAFFFLRAWEDKRGTRLLHDARRAFDEVARELYQSAVTGSIPTRYRTTFIVFLRQKTHEAVVLLIEALRAIERPLARLSYRMRMAPQFPKKEVSPLLKAILHRTSKQEEPEEKESQNVRDTL